MVLVLGLGGRLAALGLSAVNVVAVLSLLLYAESFGDAARWWREHDASPQRAGRQPTGRRDSAPRRGRIGTICRAQPSYGGRCQPLGERVKIS